MHQRMRAGGGSRGGNDGREVVSHWEGKTRGSCCCPDARSSLLDAARITNFRPERVCILRRGSRGENEQRVCVVNIWLEIDRFESTDMKGSGESNKVG